MITTDYRDELAAKWVIFPLYPITWDGGRPQCSCADPDCKSAGKHPRSSNWQHTQPYDADQLAYLEDENGDFFGNQLEDNHGVVIASSGLVVVDVDGRNGGFESAKKLAHIRELARYIVRTGSGDGEHWYFTIPSDWVGKSLATNLDDYKGIDFKSSGYVVGVGCEHASGERYEAILGLPADTTEAPAELMKMLDRPERARFVLNGTTTDYSSDDLADIVAAIPNPGRDYEQWIRIGMGLHDATGGGQDGLGIWHEWSSKSAIYDDSEMDKKWHSFGKSATRATVGTLIEWARQNGWSAPVTFTDNTDWGEMPAVAQAPTCKHDLLKPPGLVGEICTWINSRSLFPREKLAVAAALQIVSNAAGLQYLTAQTRTTLNLITIGVAGSRTGKGSIKRCMDEAHNALGLSPATHGQFKSGQELTRNAIHHQAIYYIVDEFGKQLEKVANSGKGGGAHYLESLLAELIAMYSEATGFYGISGDLKREMAELADMAIIRAVKKAGLAEDESYTEYAEANPGSAVARALAQRKTAERGIFEPYLTFFGLTEPGSFNSALEKDPWLISGGFFGRALLFEELENVPEERPPELVSYEPMPGHVLMRLAAIAGGGSAGDGGRIERRGDWQLIRWDDDAAQRLRAVKMYWRQAALDEQASGSGLEGQALGAAELMMKVAGILGVGAGRITLHDVEWSHALVKSITLDKIRRASAGQKINSRDNSEKSTGLLESIMRHVASLDAGSHTTPGRIRQAVGRDKATLDDITRAIDHLESSGFLAVERGTGSNNRPFVRVRPAQSLPEK